MCVQCPITRIRDMDPKRSRQEKTIGIRNEMLPTSSKNQLARYGAKRRYQKEDIKKGDHNRHHKEEKTKVIWSHLQNGRFEINKTSSIW